MSALRAHPRFVRHTGIVAPFLQPDVVVELIAPVGPELEDLHTVHLDPGSANLESHPHDGSWTGQHAFQGFRYRPDGSEDPTFVLNREPYRRASILIAGRNFGLGSLQGFAAIRLRQCGFRAILAPSFGPVFCDDCFDYGLLPVTLPEKILGSVVDRVVANPDIETTVDLARQTLERPGMKPIPFQVDARRRQTLLTGADLTLDERLQHADGAAAKRERDRSARPWLYDVPDQPNQD